MTTTHADTNRRALERSVAEQLDLVIEGGRPLESGWPTLAEAFVPSSSGGRYQVWASAGSHVDEHAASSGYLVIFQCQCKGGSEKSVGVTRCKHDARLVTALVDVGAVHVDSTGRYRAVPNVVTSRNLISLPNLLVRLTARERARLAAHELWHAAHAEDLGTFDVPLGHFVDAASDVWEPLVRKLRDVLEQCDRTSMADVGLRRAVAQRRRWALDAAKEALGDG